MHLSRAFDFLFFKNYLVTTTPPYIPILAHSHALLHTVYQWKAYSKKKNFIPNELGQNIYHLFITTMIWISKCVPTGLYVKSLAHREAMLRGGRDH
jgi:hypothetical protein